MNTAFKALQLKARHQVYTLLSGNNLSKLHGEGYDFAELREYQIGDDVRKINWTISAKLGTPYIKELHANRELSVVVAALMDGSLYFARDNAKQKKLVETAALLAYAAQYSGDLFNGLAFTQNDTYATPPTKQLYHAEHFIEELYALSLLGTALDPKSAMKELFARIHKPSLLFVLGDFLEETDLSLLAQKHEVIAVIIRHREEESPRKLREVTLQDPREDNRTDTYFGQRSVRRYLARQKEHDTRLLEHFARYDIRYVKIFTDEEPMEKLLNLFR